MVRVVRLERTVSWSQTRRDTNFAIPGYSLSAMIPRRTVKIKIFLSVVIYVVKAAFMPFSTTGGNSANAGATRLSGVLPCSTPDTATALPNQARYQLRYTRIFNFCHYITVGEKIKDFSVCGHSCGQSCFCAVFSNREKPAIACVARLCGVSPCPVPDTATALPKQARYQLRYTPIRYSLCIANPFLTALIVYWILAGKSTARLHIPPE